MKSNNRWVAGGAAAAVLLVGIYAGYRVVRTELGVSELTVASGVISQYVGLSSAPERPVLEPATVPDEQIEVDPAITPFREIGERLGVLAEGRHVITMRGVAIFDANGDGLYDLYFPHTGRPILVPTDEEHVLGNAPIDPLPGALFLNQGVDEAGDPVFASVQELAKDTDGANLRAELLIEDKYVPRTRIDEPDTGVGRIGMGAVAADFNGDGREDLYILNHHYGLPFQTEEMGMPVYPAPQQIGRATRRQSFKSRLPSFLWVEQDDGLVTTVDFSGQPEPEGRNSLYLNLGDSDGDGLPEWHDATEEAGVGGKFASASAAIADIDRDGDLDLYVANFMDPDFWGFGSMSFGGQRNQLYINQLAQTGTLEFIDRATELEVAGLHVEEDLDTTVWVPGEQKFIDIGYMKIDGRQVGERADHSWAAMLQDLDLDGWPDLVVANDASNRMRVYLNRDDGTRFERQTEFDDPRWDGSWMGMATADLDNDLSPEVWISNFGSQAISVRNTGLFIDDGTEIGIGTMSFINYATGHSTLCQSIFHWDGEALVDRSDQVDISHSRWIAPDMTRIDNVPEPYQDFWRERNFERGMAGLEFAWNAALFDVENDGDVDLYFAGALKRGNDRFMGDLSGSPGRMLVNNSEPGQIRFEDRTLDYRLLDIQYMDYDSNPPRRPAPGTRWHKRDNIYVTDVDAYSGVGLSASQQSITRDLFRMHEAANAIVSADLNGDGFEDLVVTHAGFYDSVSPDARNLKVAIGGRTLSVPAPNKLMRPPTQLETGHTSLYVNGGPREGDLANWVRLRLIGSQYNLSATGAHVVVNDNQMRTMRPTGAAFGGAFTDLNIGLGDEALNSVQITWPDGDPTPERFELTEPVINGLVCVERGLGVVDCGGDAGAVVPARAP